MSEQKMQALLKTMAPMVGATAERSISLGTPLSKLVVFVITDAADDTGRGIAFSGTVNTVRGALDRDQNVSILGDDWLVEARGHLAAIEQQPAQGMVRLVLFCRYGWARARVALTTGAVS